MGKHYLETFEKRSVSITEVILFTNLNKQSWNFIAVFPQL